MCFSTRGVFQSLLQCARCERATYLQLILFFSGVHGFIDAAVPVFCLQTLMHNSSFFRVGVYEDEQHLLCFASYTFSVLHIFGVYVIIQGQRSV